MHIRKVCQHVAVGEWQVCVIQHLQLAHEGPEPRLSCKRAHEECQSVGIAKNDVAVQNGTAAGQQVAACEGARLESVVV